MTALAPPPLPPVEDEAAIEPEPPPPPRRKRGWLEPLLVFVLGFSVYAGIGLYFTFALDYVEEDAEARLAHAYFVLWNSPPKLAATGFYWPPVETLVYIPFALIKPLATSLAALALCSALFGAVLLVALDWGLRRHGVGVAARWAVLVAVGLNPLLLKYGSDGMSETLYLSLLTLGLVLFLVWAREPRWYHLPLAGLVLAFGVLSRYEVMLWVGLVAVGVCGVAWARQRRWADVEGSALVLLAPVAYGLVVWAYLSWETLKDPLAWLASGTSNLATAPVPASPPAGGAGPGAAVPAAGPALPDYGIVHSVSRVVRLELGVFWPALVLALVLLVWAAARRSLVALLLAGALLANAALTVETLVHNHSETLMHLRYHIRLIPLAAVAVVWLLGQFPPRFRTAAGLAAAALLAAGSPWTVHTMLRYHANEKGEHAFIEGLWTGRSQDGVPQPYGTGISPTDDRRMARYIREHVHGTDVVLTDDAQTYGVMLADGDPARYLDRIDLGQRRWEFVRDHPLHRGVRWVLVQSYLGGVAIDADQILANYPTLIVPGPRPPIFRLAYRTGGYLLFRLVNAAPPPAPATSHEPRT